MKYAPIIILILLVCLIFMIWLFVMFLKNEKVEKAKREKEYLKNKLAAEQAAHTTYVQELKKNEEKYHEAVSDPKRDNGTAAVEFLHQLAEESKGK